MTSTIQSLCPSCNGHIPFIDISYEYPNYYLNINCECGFPINYVEKNQFHLIFLIALLSISAIEIDI